MGVTHIYSTKNNVERIGVHYSRRQWSAFGDIPDILQEQTMKKKQLWLPKLKTGALSRMLDIPEEKDIPMGLLTKIKKAPLGTAIINPYPIGIRVIHVTPLLKKRAVLAHTLKKMRHRR